MHNKTHYITHGVFLDDDYKEFERLCEAVELFDTSIALGIVEKGSVIGWLSLEDYEILYNHQEVYDHADCHQRNHS